MMQRSFSILTAAVMLTCVLNLYLVAGSKTHYNKMSSLDLS
jgi:hypothetical protein